MNQEKNIIRNDLLPAEFYLSQNYPNPFRESTVIKYCIPFRTLVKITVCDQLKDPVVILVNEEKPAGTYEVTFNAADLPGGVYLLEFRADNFMDTKKLILLE